LEYTWHSGGNAGAVSKQGGSGWRRWRRRRQATMNAVDGGGATATAAVDDGGGVEGAFFCTVFVAFSWLFPCCFEGKVVPFWR